MECLTFCIYARPCYLLPKNFYLGRLVTFAHSSLLRPRVNYNQPSPTPPPYTHTLTYKPTDGNNPLLLFMKNANLVHKPEPFLIIPKLIPRLLHIQVIKSTHRLFKSLRKNWTCFGPHGEKEKIWCKVWIDWQIILTISEATFYELVCEGLTHTLILSNFPTSLCVGTDVTSPSHAATSMNHNLRIWKIFIRL